MSDFKYVFEKHKNAIFVGTSLIGLVVVGLTVYNLIKSNRPVGVPEDTIYEDLNIRKAHYIIGGDKKGKVDLISTKTNSVIESIDLKGSNTLYSRDNNLEKVMAYSDGTYYELLEKDGKLEEKKVVNYSDKNINIKSFKFSNKYIVALEKDKFVITSLDKKETYIQDFYKYELENEKNNKINDKSKDKLEDKSKEEQVKYNVDSYVVAGKNLLYGYGDLIITVDLDSKEEKAIKIGDTTNALFVMKDNVIAFNKFGSGANNSTLLKLRPMDLNIEKVYKHENKNIYALTPDSDDDTIPFTDRIDKNTLILESHFNLNIDEVKNNKKRTPLISPEDAKAQVYNPENTVSTKGYVYSNVSGQLNIYDLRAQANDIVVSTEKDFFMPILK